MTTSDANSRPVADDVRRLLDYDEHSGVLTWRVSPSRRTKAGSVAGTVTAEGYVVVSIKGRDYKAHHLAVLLKTGHWPLRGTEVDHRDHRKSNNTWLNLRTLSKSGNLQNHSGPQANSSTGIRGVFFRADGRRLPWVGGVRAEGVLRTKAFANAVDAEAWTLSTRKALHKHCPENREQGAL